MSKCWYCNEELTTANYCDEHIGICTKCYNSMFKVSDGFVKGLTNKISDLEAKLAENEEQIWALENQKLHAHNCLNKLKQQLAEKDKKQKRTNKVVKQFQKRLKYFSEQDQDKISFCIEKLEKVKKNIKKCNYKDFGIMYQSDAIRQLDNQIDELKNELTHQQDKEQKDD